MSLGTKWQNLQSPCPWGAPSSPLHSPWSSAWCTASPPEPHPLCFCLLLSQSTTVSWLINSYRAYHRSRILQIYPCLQYYHSFSLTHAPQKNLVISNTLVSCPDHVWNGVWAQMIKTPDFLILMHYCLCYSIVRGTISVPVYPSVSWAVGLVSQVRPNQPQRESLSARTENNPRWGWLGLACKTRVG